MKLKTKAELAATRQRLADCTKQICEQPKDSDPLRGFSDGFKLMALKAHRRGETFADLEFELDYGESL